VGNRRDLTVREAIIKAVIIAVLLADVGFYDMQYDDYRPKVALSGLALAMLLKQRDLTLDNLKVPRAVSSATVLNRILH